MKRILIVGANGFTGRRILNDLSIKGYDHIIGASLHADIRPSNDLEYDFFQVDIRQEKAVKLLFEKAHPDILINTSALSVPDYCEHHPEEAYLTNVTTVKHLARMSEAYSCRIIHLSTDFVFDGLSDRLYTEEDQPNPVNYYGFTKWKGEEQISEYSSNYAIARVAIVYGEMLDGQHGNIIKLAAERLRKGDILQVVSDQYRTPTFVGDVSKGIESLLTHKCSGVYHIAGPECVSIADIAYQVADVLKLDTSLIREVSTKEIKEATPRPLFSGLNIGKAQKELNYQPLTLRKGIEETFNQK